MPIRLLILSCFLLACADQAAPTWPSDARLVLQATANSVLVSWPTPVDDDAIERIEVQRDGETVAELSSDAHDFTVPDLDDSTQVRISVAAYDKADNRSEWLHESISTLDATPPHWPAGARLVREGTEVRWVAANDAVGVTAYRLVGGGTTLSESNVTRFEVGPAPEVPEGEVAEPETFEVIAVDAAGNLSAPLRMRASGEEEIVEVAPEAVPPDAVAPTELPTQGPPPTISPAVRDALRNAGRLNLPGIRRYPEKLDIPVTTMTPPAR